MESTVGGAPDAQAKNAVAIPAILLMVVAILGVLFALYGVASSGEAELRKAMDEAMQNPLLPQMYRDYMRTNPVDVSWARYLYGFLAVLSAFVFFGALRMKNLQSYGLAMAAAIVACLPCCGPCLGCLSLPLGIWSLIVLTRPDVKQSFR
jgi:amino acid transporter